MINYTDEASQQIEEARQARRDAEIEASYDAFMEDVMDENYEGDFTEYGFEQQLPNSKEFASRDSVKNALVAVCESATDKSEEALYGAMIDKIVEIAESEGIVFIDHETAEEWAGYVEGYSGVYLQDYQKEAQPITTETSTQKYKIISDFVGGEDATADEINKIVTGCE